MYITISKLWLVLGFFELDHLANPTKPSINPEEGNPVGKLQRFASGARKSVYHYAVQENVYYVAFGFTNFP